MRITKRQLKRIIKEEKLKLHEQWGGIEDTGSDMLEFARAYAGLGGAVQDQVNVVVAHYIQFGDDEEFMNVVYNQNPNALVMAQQKLGRFLDAMRNDDSMSVLEALDIAVKLASDGGGNYDR